MARYWSNGRNGLKELKTYKGKPAVDLLTQDGLVMRKYPIQKLVDNGYRVIRSKPASWR